MLSAYHNTSVGVWASRHPGVKRYKEYDDGTYESIISVAVVTDEETGRVVLMMTLDEVGPGLSPTPQSIAVYEVAAHKDAIHDATTIGALLGLRARFSTVVTGWLWWEYDPQGTTEFPLEVVELL